MSAGAGVALPHRTKLLLSASYMLGHFCVGLTLGLKGPALLAMATQLERASGTDPSKVAAHDEALTAVGAANGAASFGLMLGSLAAGQAVDRLEHWHRWYAGTWLGMGLAFGGFKLFQTPTQLAIVSVCHGACIGSMGPCWNFGTMQTWGDKCGPYMQALHAAFGVGMFISPIAVGFELNATGSFHATAFGLVLFVCGLSVVPLYLPTPQTVPASMNSTAAAEDEEGRLLTEPEKDFTSVVAKSNHTEIATEKQRAERTLLAAVYAFIFLYCIAELSVGTWVPAYATIRGLTTPAEAAALGSLFWASFTAGRVSGICISQRVSSIRMIGADLCLLLVAVTLMVVTDGYVGTGSVAMLWVCMGIYGFGLGTIIAACMTMLAESGVQMTGSRAAGQTVFGLCGDVTGQAIMSIVFTKLGAERFMQAAWLTIAASSALFVIIAQVFVPRMISVANGNGVVGDSP